MRVEPLAALLFAILLAFLYHLGFQDRMVEDGAGLATLHAQGEPYGHHFLYLPAARVVEAVFGAGEDPVAPVRLVSVLAAALGCWVSWLLACRMGASWRGATVATVLLAASPVLQFFGTTVEVHALHLLVASAAALGTWSLPWGRPALALPLAALLLGSVYLAHPFAVLAGPGWVLLVQAARARTAEPFSVRTLLLVVGPVLLGGLVVAHFGANLVRDGALFPERAVEFDILLAFSRPPRAWYFPWEGMLLPLALLLPAAALGWAKVRRGDAGERWLAAAWAVLFSFPAAFLTWWGVAEWGGYFLGAAPFLVAAAARFEPRFEVLDRAAVAWILLVTLHVNVGMGFVDDWDRGWRVEDRNALIRSMYGETGAFYATSDNAPQVDVYFPGMLHIRGHETLAGSFLRGDDVEAFVGWNLPMAEQLLDMHGQALFDLSFEVDDRPAIVRRRPYFTALVAELEARYSSVRIEDDHWPMLLVER